MPKASRAPKTRINWKRVWRAFDRWTTATEKDVGCPPRWDVQQRKIRALVEAEVARGRCGAHERSVRRGK